jgi:hypothetical protein
MPLDAERTHDSLGRRLRDVAVSTGKHITREEADLVWFEAIHRLGHQTSAALYELTKHLRRDKQRALHRMRDLRHEKDSDYGGPTLFYPLQQEKARRPDRNLNVYGITRYALEGLKASGRYREHTPTTNHNEWKHDFMGACVATSLYLGAREHPERYEFIFEDEIVSRLGGVREFRVTYSYAGRDGTAATREAILRSDGFNGIRYLPSGEERIFIREEDCGTERNDSDDRSAKSHKHNILQYAAFFQSAERRMLFGEARTVVLSTFSSPTKMRNVMTLLLELSGGRGSNFMLFRSCSAFGDRFRPPAPSLELFTGPWERAGHAPFYVNTLSGQALQM